MKKILSYLAKRYIAGESRKDAIETAKGLNKDGISVTIDNLGENVTQEKEALENAGEYIGLLEEMQKEGVNGNLSLKLTHMGLDISTHIAKENVEKVIKKSSERGGFVWFDMEGSRYTEKTLSVFLDLRKRYANIGIAIQSCLLRSIRDIDVLIEANAAVRLVKGAYKEPPQIAFSDKKDVDRNFSLLMKKLFLAKTYIAVATHDGRLIDEALNMARDNDIENSAFEFQMLLGIKRTLQKELARQGYSVRVYVPYGKNWLPYTLRRLRERKENIWFVIKNVMD